MAPRKPKAGDILIANETFSVGLDDGTTVVVTKDQTRVRAGHEIHQKAPQLFSPITAHYDVEAATAAPGEKRGEA